MLPVWASFNAQKSSFYNLRHYIICSFFKLKQSLPHLLLFYFNKLFFFLALKADYLYKFWGWKYYDSIKIDLIRLYNTRVEAYYIHSIQTVCNLKFSLEMFCFVASKTVCLSILCLLRNNISIIARRRLTNRENTELRNNYRALGSCSHLFNISRFNWVLNKRAFFRLECPSS